MVSSQIQTPVDKVCLEFVDRATQIIDLIYAHLDAEPNCPHCIALLSKNGLSNQLNTNTDDTTIPKVQLRNDQR